MGASIGQGDAEIRAGTMLRIRGAPRHDRSHAMGHQSFLRELGRRLRTRREALDLGVAETARAAGISRRTLTEAEAGRANPTLVVLLGLAEALEVPLAELLGAPDRSRPRERVALVGLRGAGKSTVGRLLARELEVPFVELDARVEERAGLGLGEIFEVHGEEGFHAFERDALERVLSEGERVVVAAGGSIVASERNFQRLRETCCTVWLTARPEDHYQRVVAQGDRRPMQDRPRAREELASLLKRREALYALCEHRVDTSGRSPRDVARRVAECIASATPAG